MSYTIVQGNMLPVLSATLSYADGTPADLTGATVNLVLKNVNATSTYLSAACTAAGSTVTYNWVSGDTAVPGDYVGEFVVTFPDGTLQSFPTEGYFPVTIAPSLTGSVKPRPTYLTTEDLIAQTRLYLDGRVRPSRNQLASTIGATDTTLVLAYDSAGAAQGLPICIGLETMYVWDASGRNLTVERGADHTVPSQHAAGDTILIDPEFTDAQILTAINLTLTRLPSAGVYGVKALDLDLVATKQGYDLAADVVSVLDVRWQDPVDSTRWTPVESFEVTRNMPVAQFPSGVALILPERPQLWPVVTGTGDTYPMRVRYRTTFPALGSLFDDVLAVTAMPESATDLLPLGAAIRLMDGAAVRRVRTQAQPDARDGAEVRVSDVLNAAAALRQEYAARLEEEANKLGREQPYRMPTRTLMGNTYSRPGWWR